MALISVMRHIVIIINIFLITLYGAPAHAQSFYAGSEWGYSLGCSQYFGDLNENYGFKTITPAFGLFARIHFNPYISLSGQLNATRVSYADSFSTNPYHQYRNLSFASDVIEAVVQAEFNFFRYATGEKNSRVTPFLALGIGMFYYNPYTVLNGKKYYLQALGTEGQNVGYNDRKYLNFSACFPIGMGFKIWLLPGFNCSIQIADRLTLTDYLDDVSNTYVGSDKFPSNPTIFHPGIVAQDPSILTHADNPLGRAGKQRGNTTTYDQYMMMMVNFSFQMKTYRCPNYIRRDIGDL